MTEENLWLRAYVNSGDELAFTRFTERYIGLVYHAALRQLGNASFAEEVAQTVFTRLARKAPALLAHDNIVGWLHSTARNAGRELRRKESRRRQRDHEGHLMHELLHQSSEPISWDQLRPVIDEALSKLNDADRTAILLRYFADLPLAVVGARLNIAENTARMRVGRALERLQVQLAKRGITSSAAALAIGLAQHTSFAAPAGLSAVVSSIAVSQAGAASVGAGVTAVGFLQLMATTKLSTMIAGAIAAVALGTAYQQATRAKAAETAWEVAAEQQSALLRRVETAEQKARLHTTTVDATTPTVAVVDSKALQPASSSNSSSSQTLEEAIERLLVSNPDLPPLFMRQETIRFRAKYGPFYAALSFTPEQIARFEATLADHSQATSDIRIAGLAKGIKRDDPAVKKLLDQAVEQRNAQLRVVLGDAAYEQFQDYERTSNGRVLSDRLAAELYYTSHPISAGQANDMARIASNNTAKTTATGMAGWDKIISEAQGVLSPEQLVALRGMKEQAELGMAIHAITGPVSRQFSEAAEGARASQPSVSAR
jgi:RNA polymerase sigma factor (sigma-70 family)